MRIAIDMQTTLGQKTGIGFYVDNLVRWLEQIDKENTYVKLLPRSSDDFRSLERFVWDQVHVPFRSARARVDLLHQPGFSAPVVHSMPVIVTVHDLIAIHFGRDIPLGSRLYFGKWMPLSYRFARHIIAVSQHTKRDLVTLLGIPPDRITVVASAADERYQPLRDRSTLVATRDRFKTGARFVLHVGTLNPRKNLEFLVRVFAKVRPVLDRDTRLVVTGKKGWYYESLFQLVHDLKLDDAVVFTGYVTEEEKVALYNAATVLAFPSLYEGFGLPPLEAMQCGTPVIASQTSSIPEVVGQAGVLLDPTDEAAWVTAMGTLLTDQAAREQLSSLGLAQAAKFSWERTAHETKAVYARVLRETAS